MSVGRRRWVSVGRRRWVSVGRRRQGEYLEEKEDEGGDPYVYTVVQCRISVENSTLAVCIILLPLYCPGLYEALLHGHVRMYSPCTYVQSSAHNSSLWPSLEPVNYNRNRNCCQLATTNCQITTTYGPFIVCAPYCRLI